MNNRGRLNPGPLTISNINWNYASLGIIILLSAFTLYILYDETDSSLLNPVLTVFALIGILCILSAFSKNANTVYLKGGKCNILEGSINCSGGCKKCSFAHAYLQMIKDREDSHDDEAPEYIIGESVFIGNEKEDSKIHQSMRKYDKE